MDENTKHLVAAQLTQAFCQRHMPSLNTESDPRLEYLQEMLDELTGDTELSYAAVFRVYEKFLVLLEHSHAIGDKAAKTDEAAK